MRHSLGVLAIVLATLAFARLLTTPGKPTLQRIAQPAIAFALLMIGSHLV